MSRPSLPFSRWIPLVAVVAIAVAGLAVLMRNGGNSADRLVPASTAETSTPLETVRSESSVLEVTEPAPSAARDQARPADGEPTAPRQEATRPAPSPARSAGMIVGINPETGRPGMPSPEQREAIRNGERDAAPSASLDRSGEGLQVVHRPDGSRSIDLQGRFHEYTVIRIRPDGTKEQICVQGPDVEAALRTGSDNDGASEPAGATESTER